MISSDDQPSNRFDWENAKRRLDQSRRSLSDAENLTADQCNHILQQRAAQLAHVPEQPLDTSQVVEVVRFRIGTEAYAIATEWVVELMRPSEITPIPQTEKYFVGVTNLRGEVTAVVDLGVFLGVASDPEASKQLLVLGHEKPDFAIKIDSIDHVLLLRRDQLLDPGGVGGSNRDLMVGCTDDGLLVLSGEELLKCEALCVDQTE
ncbi:MAG: chemotaxis protein CheW [Pirellulaceae bacterium]|nr:chemotaxis protein CheW [Pirellulaceae bacterium]